MDKLNYYRHLTKKTLTEHYALAAKTHTPDVESILVFDESSDNYLLMNMGWKLDVRIKNTIIHVRLQNNKIWIEEDWTEEGVVNDYLEAGVSSHDLVLAFHPPHLRRYTDFAIA